MRKLGFQVLACLGPDAEAAVDTLIAFLKDSDRSVRLEALNLIGCTGPGAAQATPILVEMLEGSDKQLRLEIIFTLGQISRGDTPAIPALIAILSGDDDQEVCRKRDSETQRQLLRLVQSSRARMTAEESDFGRIERAAAIAASGFATDETAGSPLSGTIVDCRKCNRITPDTTVRTQNNG